MEDGEHGPYGHTVISRVTLVNLLGSASAIHPAHGIVETLALEIQVKIMTAIRMNAKVSASIKDFSLEEIRCI